MAKSLYDINDEVARERNTQKAIKKHRSNTRGQKLKSYPVGDPCNTVFLCSTPAKAQAAIDEYKRTHENFWR